MANYYEIIGVSENANKEAIKAAYKSRALEWHPDRNDGDVNKEELFKQLNEAYQVLSNPYKRSNYDMLLRYGQKPYTTPERPIRPNPFVFSGHRIIRKVKVSAKDNLKATLYAFLFTFVVAGIIKTSIYFLQQYQEQKTAKMLDARRKIFRQIKVENEYIPLQATLTRLDSLGYFHSSEKDFKEYKDQLINDIKADADQLLIDKKFQQAIWKYDLIRAYPICNSLDYLRKMALAYKETNNIKKSLEMYQRLYFNGYQTMEYYFEIGQLYEEKVGDYDMALNYYQIGTKKAVGEYESTIGKAYPVIINARMIPKQHYHMYMKVADMQVKLGKYEEAIQSLAWAGEIWSDSLKIYQIKAKCFEELGQKQKRNDVIKAARKIDPDFSY